MTYHYFLTLHNYNNIIVIIVSRPFYFTLSYYQKTCLWGMKGRKRRIKGNEVTVKEEEDL